MATGVTFHPLEKLVATPASPSYFPRLSAAGVAQLVEHFLAKEDVASSSLVTRSMPEYQALTRIYRSEKVLVLPYPTKFEVV